jgi:hypothetical protein
LTLNVNEAAIERLFSDAHLGDGCLMRRSVLLLNSAVKSTLIQCSVALLAWKDARAGDKRPADDSNLTREGLSPFTAHRTYHLQLRNLFGAAIGRLHKHCISNGALPETSGHVQNTSADCEPKVNASGKTDHPGTEERVNAGRKLLNAVENCTL